MSELPTQARHQQAHALPVSGEHLEVMGKKAAADWQQSLYPTLTEAVTETVKQAQLSPEQVKRVVEFTNTAAFLTEFKKEGSSHRVIEFDGGPADISIILMDLNDGGGGTVFDRGTLDYSSPPSHGSSTKTASSEEEEAFAAMFGIKEGSREITEPFADPYAPVLAMHDKLAGAASHLTSEISGFEIAYADLGDRLYHQVKQASLNGVSLGQVLQALELVAPAEEYIKVAFTLMTPRLLREGVFPEVDSMLASFDKVASAGTTLNEEHPLVADFKDFCDVLQKLAEVRAVRTEVIENRDGLSGILKNAASTASKAVKVLMDTSHGAANKAAPYLKEHLGETAGGLAAGTIKHAPLLGAALAGNEAYTHYKNSPSLPARAARGAVDVVARQVPGTQAQQEHEWRIQNGQ